MNKRYLLLFLIVAALQKPVEAQEYDLTGFELSIDQDYFADFLRDSTTLSDNYTVALRLGFYGALANHPYLALPFVREKIDGFLLDKILYNIGFRQERKSHNFVFTVVGFSPQHISDQIPDFAEDTLAGYSHFQDRPFSSFTGFRSTRRIEGNKLFVHSARRLDMAINSSFTFGFASLGLVKSVENLFGAHRPDGNLWEQDGSKEYAVGQVNRSLMPVFMYQLAAEAVIWRPAKKLALQVRPELSLGYYTHLGLGFDIGKVMNVEKMVDNLSYTDTHNPGVLLVNNEHLSLAISAGAIARLVLYNAHLSGWFGWGDDHYISFSDTKRVIYEAYAGIKLQAFKKVEINFSVNTRTAEFNLLQAQRTSWGTFGLKILLAEEGEGCYD
jgi:hypothetical protein